ELPYEFGYDEDVGQPWRRRADGEKEYAKLIHGQAASDPAIAVWPVDGMTRPVHQVLTEDLPVAKQPPTSLGADAKQPPTSLGADVQKILRSGL
ncbi:unnamed protein product, partial [Prorocentrum cordatum]